MSAVAGRLEPNSGCEKLLQAMAMVTDSLALAELGHGLSKVEPPGTSQHSAQGAIRILEALREEQQGKAVPLAKSLASLASRDPDQAATVLLKAMTLTNDAGALCELALGISTLAPRLEPGAAQDSCSRAAAIINRGIASASRDGGMLTLCQGLSALAVRMNPKDGVMALSTAMAVVTDSAAYSTLAHASSSVAARLTSDEAAPVVANRFCQVIAKAPSTQPRSLQLLLTRSEPKDLSRRLTAIIAAGPVANIDYLLEPMPCHLSTQQLIDLLKQPALTGPARRVVLDQMQNRYRRRFRDHWAFVRFAIQEDLGMDLISPPQRDANNSRGG